MSKEQWLMVDESGEGERLDHYISENLESLSRSQVQKLIEEGRIIIDGAVRKASYRLREGEEIRVQIPLPQEVAIVPQDIPLEILYQDNDVVVVNKPKDMVVHPAHGNWDRTMVNALLYHVHDLSGINGELRPGIVHRLDKDTSGVMVAAKNDQAHRALAQQIKDHTIRRQYQALVYGVIKENLGSIDAPIGRSKTDRKKMAVISGGRPSISEYQILERFQDYCLVKVTLLTGRTHQIRVHFAYIHHPVVGDPLYTSRKAPFGVESQLLHACLLGFVHPSTGQYMEFESPLPAEFQAVLNQLRSKK